MVLSKMANQRTEGAIMDLGREHIDGLVQERRNSRALALELRLYCTEPSIYKTLIAMSSIWLLLDPIMRGPLSSIWVDFNLSMDK